MRGLRSCLLLASSAPLLAQDFERLRFLLPEGASALDTAVDFDGDGDVDLLGDGVEFGSSSEVLLFRNAGGKLEEEILFDLGPGESWTGVLPRDLDGDGRLDLLLTSRLSADHLLRQQPDGSFVDTPPPNVPKFGRVDGADVDGDGDADLLYSGGRPNASFGNEPNRLLLNDGTGTFVDGSALFPDVSESTALFFDFDGDGDHDVLRDAPGLAGYPDDLLENDGTGGLRARPIELLGVPAIKWLTEIRDFEHDGDLDVLSFPGIMNRGDGTFVSLERGDPGVQTFVPMTWTGAGTLDFVSNGIYGLICKCPLPGLFAYTSDRVEVPDPVLQAQSSVNWLLARDWDSDGDDDIFFGGESTKSAMLFSRGRDGFESRVLPADSLSSGGVRLADVDGDGDLDAFSLVDVFSLVDIWYENDGTGGGWLEHVVNPLGNGNGSTLMDWDRDGDPDVVAQLGTSPWSMALFENDGAGGFADVSSGLPPIPSRPRDLEAGDLDGDGFPDLLLLGAGKDVLLFGNGDGTFDDVTSFVDIPSSTLAGTLADLDGDGDLDAVLHGSSLAERYDNPGDGLLVATGRTLGTGATGDLELADLDLDGALDLVTYRSGGGRLDVYRGDGAGFFAPAPVFTAQAVSGGSGSVVDLDGDGRPDLLLSGPSLLWNAGGFAFEDRSGQIQGHATSSIPLAADLDLDGDLDLWSPGTRGGTRLLWNLERQLAWHHWPLAGRPIVLDARGTPATPFGLWVDLRPPVSNVPGAFRLDAGSATFVGASSLDALGRSLPRIELPAELSVVGTELYWQALIGVPYRWSNVERTVLGP